MKYKIGDKVRVIPDLKECDPRFGVIGVEEEMEAFRGKKVTIAKIYDLGGYLIHEDGEEYVWAEDMFSEITEFTLDDLETRMVVETRDKERYLIFREGKGIHLMNARGISCLYEPERYGPDMMHFSHEKDIVKVFGKISYFEEAKNTGQVLWERKEPKKMTLKEIIEKLGYDVEIIPECEAENEK